jgi:hypothetical protein
MQSATVEAALGTVATAAVCSSGRMSPLSLKLHPASPAQRNAAIHFIPPLRAMARKYGILFTLVRPTQIRKNHMTVKLEEYVRAEFARINSDISMILALIQKDAAEYRGYQESAVLRVRCLCRARPTANQHAD